MKSTVCLITGLLVCSTQLGALAAGQAEMPEVDPSATAQDTPVSSPGAPEFEATQAQPYTQQPQSEPPYAGQPQYGEPAQYGAPSQYGAQPQQFDEPATGQNGQSYAPAEYGQAQPYGGYGGGYAGSGYTGYRGYMQTPPQGPQFGPPGRTLHPRVATAPAGLTIPVTLQTAISTQVARVGDFVQASINANVPLQGLSYIPSGSVITGQVSEALAGRMMERSGSLGVEFTRLQLPDGESVPIQAHVLGDLGKYQNKNGVYRGEGFGTKAGNFALRAGAGAGLGAALGTALGAIAGGRLGTGAWAGAAIGGGLGAVDSLFLRRGRNVLIPSGTPMQIQLDAQVEVPVDIQPVYGAS